MALIVAGIAALGFHPSNNERQLQVVAGRTAISFFPSIIESSGLRLTLDATADPDETSGEESVGFKIFGSNLRFTLTDASFTRFDGGAISHTGGFRLANGRNVLNATKFTIQENEAELGELQLVVGPARRPIVAFRLTSAGAIYELAQSQLLIHAMDMWLTTDGANQLGKPELAGQLIGTVTVFGQSKPIDGDGKVLPPSNGGVQAAGNSINVQLFAMSSLTSLGRTGTYPNGLNGLSMSTTSCNVGTGNIEWRAPMQVQHPVIAMNLYRVKDGKFEQVGWSWLKHGFLSTNSNGCGTCQHPGTGSLLGPNCSDTYGTGNNGDRRYLGERDEVNPFTGVWTCTNSYFSNYEPDCIRRNDGSGLDAVAHRLIVHDSDLGNANSQYYYEAYYINANDEDVYNNIGSRTATMSWNGSSWQFSTTTAQLQGPAINRWGDMRSTAQPQTEGDVIVAVQTTSLGGGVWRYEFAVYNHNLDRQVREFSIPVPTGANVTNVGFRDIDKDSNNNWTMNLSEGNMLWSTPTQGSPNANPLKYSSVFNFRFDADVQPASSTADLGLFKAGSGGGLTAATKGPLVLAPVASYQIVNGVQFAGNLFSLAESDNNRLNIGPSDTGARGGTGVITSLTGPAAAVTLLTVGVESSNTLPVGQATQTIELWNWTTGLWEQVDSRDTTQSDSKAIIVVSSNPAKFVNATTREVRARVMHASILGSTGNRWTISLDQIGFHFN
ncbi:MAG: hypothetical protein WD716_10565 [Fimbriimonadaceae bacterium]